MKLTAARVEDAWRLPRRALDHLSQRRGPAPLRCAAALPPAPPGCGKGPRWVTAPQAAFPGHVAELSMGKVTDTGLSHDDIQQTWKNPICQLPKKNSNTEKYKYIISQSYY